MAKREIILDIKVLQTDAQNRLSGLVVELQKQRKELAELNQAYKTGLVSEEEFGKAAVELRQSIRLLSAEQRNLEKTTDLTKQTTESQGESLVEMRRRLTLLTKQYDSLSKEEREASEEGIGLRNTIESLSKEVLQLEEATGRSQRNVGNYKSAFEGLRTEFGGVVTSLIGGGGLVFAFSSVGDAVSRGVEYLGEITTKFQTFRGEVQSLTGEIGEPLDDLVTKIQAVAETFGKDFQEVLIAANATAKQFGISTNEALRLIEGGFLAGADASGQFLDQLEEYPAQLKSVGLSAEESIAIITQQVREGIFSDKGIDAIKEAGIRIREFTPATQAAFEGIGLNAEAIQAALTDGSKSLFDVIQEVSQRLNELPENTKEVGAAIADIFGGPGEDAGLAYLKTLKDIEGGINGLIDPTNELTAVQQAQLQTAEQLAEAENELSKLFADNQQQLSLLSKEAKIFALESLLSIIDNLRPTLDAFRSMEESLGRLSEKFGFVSEEGEKTSIVAGLIGKAIALANKPFDALVNVVDQLATALNFVIGIFTDFQATLTGVSNAASQFFTNQLNTVKSFALEVQIQFLKIKDAVSFGDAAAEQIQKLEAEQENIKASGKSIAEAFRAGFDSERPPKVEVKTEGVVSESADAGKESGKAFADAFEKESTVSSPAISGGDNSAAREKQLALFQKQQEEILRARIATIQRELLQVEEGGKRELELRKQLLDEQARLTLLSGKQLAEEELLLLAETQQKKRELENQFVNERLQRAREELLPIRTQIQERLALEAEANAQRKVDAERNHVELLDLDKEATRQQVENLHKIADVQREQDEEEKERKRATLAATAQLFGQLSQFAQKRVSVEEQIAEKQQELSRATTDAQREQIQSEIKNLREAGEVKREETVASKALAIAEVLINGYLGATKALARVELFPANIILAATIGVATVANAAKIAGVSFAEGGDTGTEGVSDPQIPGRKIVGVVHDNEYVVPDFVKDSPQGKPLVSQLETLRMSLPSFAVGGFTTPPISDFGTRETITKVENQIQLGPEFLTALEQLRLEVSVSEINRVQNRVQVKENYGSI
jgi:hypothetical protein